LNDLASLPDLLVSVVLSIASILMLAGGIAIFMARASGRRNRLKLPATVVGYVSARDKKLGKDLGLVTREFIRPVYRYEAPDGKSYYVEGMKSLGLRLHKGESEFAYVDPGDPLRVYLDSKELRSNLIWIVVIPGSTGFIGALVLSWSDVEFVIVTILVGIAIVYANRDRLRRFSIALAGKSLDQNAISDRSDFDRRWIPAAKEAEISIDQMSAARLTKRILLALSVIPAGVAGLSFHQARYEVTVVAGAIAACFLAIGVFVSTRWLSKFC
jgi:hypothetical protein